MSLASRFARLGSAAALTAALGLAQAEALHAQTDSSWLAERMSTWYRTTTRHAPGDWGIAVADGSGRLLWSVQPDEPMVPASTVKLFTTGFARTMLGGDARRSTRVMGGGSARPRDRRVGRHLVARAQRRPLARAGGRVGPDLLRSRDAARQRRRAQAEWPSAGEQLGRAGGRDLSGRVVHPPSGAALRAPGRPADPARERGLADRSARRKGGPPCAGGGDRARGHRAAGDGDRHDPVRPAQSPGAAAARRRGVGGERNPGRPCRAPPTHRGGLGSQGGPERGLGRGAQPGGNRLERQGARPRPPWSATRRSSPRWLLAPLDSLASEINRRSLNLGAELLLQWAGGRERGPERLTDHVRRSPAATGCIWWTAAGSPSTTG